MTSPSEQDIREKLNNELSVFAKYIRHHERTGLGGKNHQGVAADRILDLIIRYGNQRELESVERYITDNYGKRCETTDKEDFPDTDYDNPKNSRCITCEQWEVFDNWLAELKQQKEVV